MKDYHQILGIRLGASENEIKQAYREAVRKYHPDSHAGNPLMELAQEKMRDINEAYGFLLGQVDSSISNTEVESGTNKQTYDIHDNFALRNFAIWCARSTPTGDSGYGVTLDLCDEDDKRYLELAERLSCCLLSESERKNEYQRLEAKIRVAINRAHPIHTTSGELDHRRIMIQKAIKETINESAFDAAKFASLFAARACIKEYWDDARAAQIKEWGRLIPNIQFPYNTSGLPR